MIWISSITKDASARKRRTARPPKSPRLLRMRSLRTRRPRMEKAPRDAVRRGGLRLPGQRALRVRKLTSRRSRPTQVSKNSREPELPDLRASADPRARTSLSLKMVLVFLVRECSSADPTAQEVKASTTDQGPKAQAMVNAMSAESVAANVVVAVVATRAPAAEAARAAKAATKLRRTPTRRSRRRRRSTERSE